MRDYTVTEQFALVGLNGQDSRHNTTAKKIVLKGIAVAEVLERLLERGYFWIFEQRDTRNP